MSEEKVKKLKTAISIDRDVYDQLVIIAEKYSIGISTVINLICRQYLKDQDVLID